MANDTAVVLSCHGTVERVEDIPAFVQNIRRGRPTPDHIIEEVTSRFEHIGGSPLMRITREQAAALEERLGLPVRAAARLWHPYPDEVLEPLAADGVERLISVPLAPQSVSIYHDALAEAAEPRGMTVHRCEPWGEEPALVQAFADAIVEAAARLEAPSKAAFLLTAHSLPLRVIAAGDRYEIELRAMAGAVEAELDRRDVPRAKTQVVFQSQGMGGGEWLGPDLETAFTQAREEGIDSLLIAPIGFLAEHVETLYDIDVEAKAQAEGMGFVQLERMAPMNTRPRFIDALEAVARRVLDGV